MLSRFSFDGTAYMVGRSTDLLSIRPEDAGGPLIVGNLLRSNDEWLLSRLTMVLNLLSKSMSILAPSIELSLP